MRRSRTVTALSRSVSSRTPARAGAIACSRSVLRSQTMPSRQHRHRCATFVQLRRLMDFEPRSRRERSRPIGKRCDEQFADRLRRDQAAHRGGTQERRSQPKSRIRLRLTATLRRSERHGQEELPDASKTVESAQARRGHAQEHPDGRVPVGDAEGRARPGPRRLRAAQPRSRPAARLARQGRAGLVATSSSTRRRSTSRRRSTPRSLIDDLLRETQEREARGRADHGRPVRRLQRHAQGRGQDRVLPARPELVEPHDPRRLACR